MNTPEVNTQQAPLPALKPALFDVVKNQALLLFAFSVLLYVNTLWFDYTLDDMLMITSNKFTKQGVSGIKDIMTNDTFVGFFGENKNLLPGGRYRPLSQVWFALEYQFFGKNPFVGHLFNVLLYGCLAVVLFYVLRQLFPDDTTKRWYLRMPFLVTALFMAHPLHTEVVANIKGRDEIMGLMACMGVIYFTLRYIDTNKLQHLGYGFVLYLLGLLSKENALTFFAVVPLTVFTYRQAKLKSYGAFMLPLVLALVVYFVGFRLHALGFVFTNDVEERELLNNPFVKAVGGERFATVMFTWLVYLRLLFIPHPLTHDYYPFHITENFYPDLYNATTKASYVDVSDIRCLLPMLLYGGMALYAIIRIWKKDLVAYAILFFFITFSIQSNLVFNIGAFMNERFMFISLLGFCVIAAWFLTMKLPSWIRNTVQYHQTAVIVLTIVLGFYSFKTFTRNYAWKDDPTLFTTDVKTSVHSAKCNVSAGGMLIGEAQETKDPAEKKEKLDLAVMYLTKAMNIHPGHVAGWILLGNAYLEFKNYELSRYYYENCLKVSRKHADALNNLLVVAQRANNEQQYLVSIDAYKTLLKYEPDKLEHLQSMAEVYSSIGRTDTSIAMLKEVIRRKPDAFLAYNILGKIYGKELGDLSTSIQYLTKAFELKPDNASILENLGVAHGILRQFDKSIRYFKLALELSPENAQLHTNLGSSYRQIGLEHEANECFLKAQELKGG